MHRMTASMPTLFVVVVIPVVAALAPWYVYANANHNTDNTFDASVHWIAALPPLIGVLATLIYGALTRTSRLMWPLVPWAVAAVTFSATTMVIAKTDNAKLEYTTDWYSNVSNLATLGGLSMVVFAFAGVAIFGARLRGTRRLRQPVE